MIGKLVLLGAKIRGGMFIHPADCAGNAWVGQTTLSATVVVVVVLVVVAVVVVVVVVVDCGGIQDVVEILTFQLCGVEWTSMRIERV